MIRLSKCNNEVENHVISCHLSKESINVSELILAMAGLFNLPRDNLQGMGICYRRRHMLGRFWRSSKVTCQYPERSGQKKGIQGRDTIRVLRKRRPTKTKTQDPVFVFVLRKRRPYITENRRNNKYKLNTH